MTTLSLEGSGVAVSFSASGFSGDVIDITLTEKARETIETTHLGTEKYKTFKLGEYVDLGTLTIRVDHNPALINLIGYPAESIVISYPLQQGEVVPRQLTLSGIVYSQGGEMMKMDERMVTALQIRLTNNLTTDTISDSPPANLIDGSKILGAYDFGSASYSTANIVSGAPAASFSGPNGSTDQPIAQVNGYSGYGKTLTNNVFGSSAATGINATTTSFTIALFVKCLNVTTSCIEMGFCQTDFSTPYTVQFLLNTYGSSGISVGVAGIITHPVLSMPEDSAWHHYAVVVNGTNVKFYNDGVALLPGTLSITTNVRIDYLYEFGVMGVGSGVSWDNVFFSREALSSAAIVALSAGRLPNSSGVLA